MVRLEILGHYTVYRNPSPNRISEYVAFPAIQALADNTLLCMCRHGSARESDDGVVNIHRSTDGGESWQAAGVLPEPDGIGAGMRLPGGFGILATGEVLAWVAYPTGLNGESGQFIARSTDSGLHWSPLEAVATTPYESIGVGGNLVTLADGTLIAASEWGESEWGGTDKPLPDWAALLSRSTDNAKCWDTWRRIQGPQGARYFYDLRICKLADERLLAAYWTHDMERDEGLNVHTAWSTDGGETWTAPQDAGFWGQVTDIAALQSGRVIAVTNHRRLPMGLRAVLSEDGGQSFDVGNHLELWGIDPVRIRSAPVLARKRDIVENLLDSYHFFTFGTPSVTQMPDGTIVVAFYVTEEQVTYVRCCRMREIETT